MRIVLAEGVDLRVNVIGSVFALKNQAIEKYLRVMNKAENTAKKRLICLITVYILGCIGSVHQRTLFWVNSSNTGELVRRLSRVLERTGTSVYTPPLMQVN